MINLGFSTGCFIESCLPQQEILELLSSCGSKIVELSFLRVHELNRPIPDKKYLEPFDYVSIHAPKYAYSQDNTTKKILEAIARICLSTAHIDLVIFHPDTVRDFSVFENLDFPIAFENLDARAESFRLVAQHQELASRFPEASMVLDVQHTYTNDATGKLTAEFYKFLENF